MIMLFSFTCIRLGLRWSGDLLARGWAGRGLGVQRYRAVWSSWGCLGRFRCPEGDLPRLGLRWSRPGPLPVQWNPAWPGMPARWSSRAAWRMRAARVP
ncbi:hypothetical protein CRV15_29075 (plasmid) [Streptomyces clavuligerus]|nr:hypothetical protein CRV15_29075 [Streptomyces clavuligerus]